MSSPEMKMPLCSTFPCCKYNVRCSRFQSTQTHKFLVWSNQTTTYNFNRIKGNLNLSHKSVCIHAFTCSRVRKQIVFFNSLQFVFCRDCWRLVMQSKNSRGSFVETFSGIRFKNLCPKDGSAFCGKYPVRSRIAMTGMILK